MIKNQMKPSQIKTIVVECKMKDSYDTKEFEVDCEIFDDIFLEAATRFVEQHIKPPNARIPPILTAYEKKNYKNINKHFCYNSYYVIINAGFYKKAEVMRRNFISMSGIDLKKEKIKSDNKDNE